MKIIKEILLSLVLGYFLAKFSFALESDYLNKFASDNLIMLLIALLAINTTTIGVVAVKMKDISDKYQIKFNSTIKSMKLSIHEQVGLIVIAVIFQLIKTSKFLISLYSGIDFISTVVLLAVIIYAIIILYDTANSVFVILETETTNDK